MASLMSCTFRPAVLHGQSAPVGRKPRCVTRRVSGNRMVTRAAYQEVNGMSVKVYPGGKAEVGDDLCKMVLEYAAECVRSKGGFSLASPGGSVPTMLGKLPTMPGARMVDWSKVHLYFVNERQNEMKCCKLNRAQFADALGIPLENIHSPIGGESTPSAAAYDQTLRAAPMWVMSPASGDSAPQLDMALIGLGGDGHIGSVYPGSDTAQVFTADSLALPVDKPGKQSITMSLAMMAAATKTVIATCGEDKSDSVALALSLSAESAKWRPTDGPVPWLNAPAARLASGRGELFWMLDPAAAQKL
eukprot:4286831-Pyramimonas_sp.AAC.1